MQFDPKESLAFRRFEEAIRQGRQPRIEDFLEDAPQGGREVWLLELLLVELRYQKNNVNRDSYLSRFPADASVIEKAIENLGKEANAAGTESLLTTEVKPGPS